MKLYTTQTLDANTKGEKGYSYNVPIIPKGFRYVTGNWDTGFVISDENGNESNHVIQEFLLINGFDEEISDNIFCVTYSDGSKIVVDYNKNKYELIKG